MCASSSHRTDSIICSSPIGRKHISTLKRFAPRALLRSGDYTKVQVAKELAVSRHTLWRALAKEATP
jgi:hypothetical protein